jgi:hypothetical protein
MLAQRRLVRRVKLRILSLAPSFPLFSLQILKICGFFYARIWLFLVLNFVSENPSA